MSPDYLAPGDEVAQSPVGAGRITDISDAGYPRVNHVAVAWLVRTDGVVFNPHNKPIPAAVETSMIPRAKNSAIARTV